MAKSVKLKNNTYLDISSVIWSRVSLESRLKSVRTPNVDLDDYRMTSVYYFNTGCSNAPTNYFLCLVIGDGYNRAMQIGMPIGGTSTNIYVRKCNEGTWSAWKQL